MRILNRVQALVMKQLVAFNEVCITLLCTRIPVYRRDRDREARLTIVYETRFVVVCIMTTVQTFSYVSMYVHI